MEELQFIRPSVEYAQEIAAYKEEFLKLEDSMDGCGSLRRMTPEQWLCKIEALSKKDTCPKDKVVSTQFVCLRSADQKIVGMLQVRHYFNEYLEQYAGHIGYSVRPTERQKGYATWMLRRCLPYCAALGLEKVLVCCEDSNTGSRKVILNNRGVYDGTVFEPEEKIFLERYWVSTNV